MPRFRIHTVLWLAAGILAPPLVLLALIWSWPGIVAIVDIVTQPLGEILSWLFDALMRLSPIYRVVALSPFVGLGIVICYLIVRKEFRS